ncbi:MAG: hypothetical protein D6677_09030 [Calditrichaeota bacterium]|nr:MAG: hypothetical protein D6677_09030 [Calditrichota bacterium]
MKRKLLLFITASVFVFGGLARAQRISSESISKVGTTVGQFLKIDISARSVAMGGSFVAVTTDASAMYTNAAGIARNNGYEAMFTHTQWIAGTSYDFGAVTFKMGDMGAMGVMVSSFASGDMDVRTVEQPEGTGELFNTQDIMVGLTYARNLTDNFTIGFTGKYINQRIWHMSAATMALDVGVMYNTPFWGTVLGASIRNFGAKMRLDGRDIKYAYDPDNRNSGNVFVVNSQYEMLYYEIPLNFQVGLARTFNINDQNRFTLTVDAVTPNDNFEAVNAGFEYDWDDMFFIRGGYKSLFRANTEEGLTAGVGLNVRLEGTTMMQLDYAYADFGRLSDNTQRFTLYLRF